MMPLTGHGNTFCLALLIAIYSLSAGAPMSVMAQKRPDDISIRATNPPSGPSSPLLSPQKAMAYSLLLPGLGQRYVNDGHWGGWGTTFAVADLGLWASLFGVNWQENQVKESFRTLAATSAGASIEGKDRSFFINLATYRSSDDFLETVLRNRAWDQIGYVSDPSFQWHWSSEEAFARFRSQRDDAESLSRKRTVIIAALIANRILSGVTAAVGAGKANKRSVLMSIGPPAPNASTPTAHLQITF